MQVEAEVFYVNLKVNLENECVFMGFNFKVICNKSGELEEVVWYVDGMYGFVIQ